MTIEDKAKLYDEALKKAKDVIEQNPLMEYLKKGIEYILPELKESEDERIRKELIEQVEYIIPNDKEVDSECNILPTHQKRIDKYRAWLEKQKEFVSADFDDVWETADCEELTAPLDKYSKDAIKKMCHAWYDKGIELERRNWLEKQGEQKQDPCEHCADKRLNCHNFPCIKKKAFKQGKSALEVINEEHVNNANKVEPFDKYEGLTDFERTLADICFAWISEEESGWKQYIKDNANVLLKIAAKKFNSVQDAAFDHKPAWSYEDEANLNNIIWLCNNCIKGSETTWIPSQATKIKHLIETIKEKGLVQQNPAWSEEDKNLLEISVANLTELKDWFGKDYGRVGDCINWLKSLKDRCTWKPSDEQMDALLYISRYYAPTETDKLGWESLQTLELMLSQLKKL